MPGAARPRTIKPTSVRTGNPTTSTLIWGMVCPRNPMANPTTAIIPMTGAEICTARTSDCCTRSLKSSMAGGETQA